MARDVHSYSSLATLASCAQKFAWTYVEEIEEPTPSAPQHAGTVFDAGINMLYLGGWDVENALARMAETWGDFRTPVGSKYGHLTLPFLEERLRLYVAEREASPTIMETGKVSPIFSGEAHVFDWRGIRLKVIPDFVVEDASGRVWVTDLKTTSSWITEHWMLKFRIGHQLRLYAAAVQEITGTRVSGGLINAVYVGEKALDPPEAWRRRKSTPSALKPVDFTAEQISETWDWAHGLRVVEEACEAAGVWPKNEHACGDYGGCEFLTLCEAPSAMARKARMMTNFRRRTRRPHEADADGT